MTEDICRSLPSYDLLSNGHALLAYLCHQQKKGGQCQLGDWQEWSEQNYSNTVRRSVLEKYQSSHIQGSSSGNEGIFELVPWL